MRRMTQMCDKNVTLADEMGVTCYSGAGSAYAIPSLSAGT